MLVKWCVRAASVLTLVALLVVVSSFYVARIRAQEPAGRISGEINSGSRSTIAGSRSPLARKENDAGPVDSTMQIHGISIVFRRSAAQEAELQALIAAQQNPTSTLYHRWLTPEQFAARFGMSESDISKVSSWLKQQGFSVDSVARSRNRIFFSGTAAQVRDVFGAELHYYNVNGERHYAPSSDISVPSALASVVQDVSNLSTFRPKPHVRRPKANFTSGQTGNTFLTPKDFATIYNVNNPVINPAFGSGFTGAGQSIAVVGQTSVSLTDTEHFQNAAGLPIKDPTLLLVPGTGNVFESAGDESESDLDLEYSSAMATGASIIFVYVGDNLNFSVFDSFQYAIDNDIAPIISDSYGLCEPALNSAEYSQLNGMLAQGAAQGQTISVAAGDSGSVDCSGVQGLSTAVQHAVSVDFPASSQFVTALGGTEFPAADVCSSGTTNTPCTPNSSFWQSTPGTDIVSSAVAGVTFPEQVWNDDFGPSGGNPANLSSGGGGISVFTPRPSWQTGVPGIPSGSARLVPDIALPASPNNAGFLYCSSDPSIGITGSCSNGFRDVNVQSLTVAGGTSFDAPIFAGLVALINEKENSTGQGVVNPTLYALASNSATYAAAFHDITSGNNDCSAAGSTVCAGSALTLYSAKTGYDMASGLGSIDFDKLLSAWPASAGSALNGTRTTMSAATTAPATGVSDDVTITVAPASGSGIPTGSLAIAVDGSSANSSLPLSNSGSASFNFVSSGPGSHVITATYSGDSTFAGSTTTLVVGNQSFRLTATSPTIVTGNSGSSTVTITPQEGYTGTISWNVSPALTNGCFSIANANISNSSTVTATLTINTSSTACGGAASLVRGGAATAVTASSTPTRPGSPRQCGPLGAAMAGLLVAGVFACRSGKVRGGAGMMLVAVLLVASPGCGGGSPSNNQFSGGSHNVAPGTYTLTVIGTDTANAAISGSAGLKLTVNQ